MTKQHRGRRRARPDFPAHAPTIEVVIDHLGGRGDGVATAQFGGPHQRRERSIFVPATLPGERVNLRPVKDIGEGITCQVTEIIEASPERIDPPCPHFGACGGCALQHWRTEAYRSWKRERVVTAARRAGLEAERTDDLVPAEPETRRRAEVVFRHLKTGGILGFHERGSNHIVNIETCPVLAPGILAMAAAIRAIIPALIERGATARASINLLPGGLDLLLILPREPDRAALEALARLAHASDVLRISTLTEGDDEALAVPVIERQPPTINFASVPVQPPPGAFLQATGPGARAITDTVLDGLEGARYVADLYAGCGTLSFPLATIGRVHAVEADAGAIKALEEAARRAGLAGRLTTEVRDLARAPLRTDELARFDALVFDPPRAGARAQVEQIAAGGPARVVAASCNPSTFARDARILADGGYRLKRLTPIDQFLWSPHVELVAHFRRGDQA